MTDIAARLAEVRRLFGHAFGSAEPDSMLGDIRLRPEQCEAVARVRELIERHGGAMLADSVGAGKTYVALAVARDHTRITIASPAALRGMWQEARHRAGVRAAFVSYERLSREGRAAPGGDLVILDEAHHLRESRTRRYAAATELCRGARVLLVSATPLQNRLRELAAQLALFLGSRAGALSESELAAYVVRGAAQRSTAIPRISGPHALALPDDHDCLDLLASLPPPIPTLDEGDAGVLLLYGLVQQWSSSRAALVAALRRREARAAALSSILESGHMPSRSELASWTCADNAVQLGFPELLVAERVEPSSLLAAVRGHEAAVRATIRSLVDDGSDLARAEALRRLRSAHPGAQIVAFSQFAETVHVLFRLLVKDGAVACLTARGARIAGGTMSRGEVLAQFQPDSASLSTACRIELLLTTDVLSEGLNLQRASIVVHLDLPWNPARLEQRVGRVRRLGSPHDVVTVYAFAPPASAERLLRLRSRLEVKLGLANRTVGAMLPLPFDGSCVADHSRASAEELGAAAAILRRWRGEAPAPRVEQEPVVAAVHAAVAGFVALLAASGEPPLIVASLGAGHPVTSADVVRRALELSDGPAAEPDGQVLAESTRLLENWWAGHRAAAASGLADSAASRSRRAALARVHSLLAHSPRHARCRIAALAANARRVLATPLPRAEENSLAELARSPIDDEAWLNAIVAVGANRTTSHPSPGTAPPEAPLRAIILLQDRVTGDTRR